MNGQIESSKLKFHPLWFVLIAAIALGYVGNIVLTPPPPSKLFDSADFSSAKTALTAYPDLWIPPDATDISVIEYGGHLQYCVTTSEANARRYYSQHDLKTSPIDGKHLGPQWLFPVRSIKTGFHAASSVYDSDTGLFYHYIHMGSAMR